SRNKIKRAISREKEFVIQLDKNALTAHVDYTQEADSASLSYRLSGSTLTFYQLQETEKDSVHTTIIVQDSLLVSDTLHQKIYFREPTNRKRKTETLPIHSNIRTGQELTSDITYELFFDKPLVRMDTSKIKFLTDTLEKEKPFIQVIDNQQINI